MKLPIIVLFVLSIGLITVTPAYANIELVGTPFLNDDNIWDVQVNGTGFLPNYEIDHLRIMTDHYYGWDYYTILSTHKLSYIPTDQNGNFSVIVPKYTLLEHPLITGFHTIRISDSIYQGIYDVYLKYGDYDPNTLDIDFKIVDVTDEYKIISVNGTGDDGRTSDAGNIKIHAKSINSDWYMLIGGQPISQHTSGSYTYYIPLGTIDNPRLIDGLELKATYHYLHFTKDFPIDNPSGCDPLYPDMCISPNSDDLNCADITYRNFTVIQPDPHRFDGDKDGIGCEK